MGTKIIAVAGGSGSGKTTFVGRLVAACGAGAVQVLQLDHYYRDLSELQPDERNQHNFDHPSAFDTTLLRVQLAALAAGEAVDRPTYDFATHTRLPDTVRLHPAPVIVLDGILALHWPEVRQHLKLAVYVNVDDDVRFIRRLGRDIRERGRSVESVIAQYLATVKTMHDAYVAPQRLVADIVVDWRHYNDDAVTRLAAQVATWHLPKV